MSIFSFFFACVFLMVSCTKDSIIAQGDDELNSISSKSSLIDLSRYDYYLSQKGNPDYIHISYPAPKTVDDLLAFQDWINEDGLVSLNYDRQTLIDILNKQDDPNVLEWAVQQKYILNFTKEKISDFILALDGVEFDEAIKAYGQDVLNSYQSKEELEENTLLINGLYVFHDMSPEMFSNSSKSASPLGCILAVMLWLGATASIAGCASIFGCFLAVAAWVVATNNMLNSCQPADPGMDLDGLKPGLKL